jgi:hypothetical protein
MKGKFFDAFVVYVVFLMIAANGKDLFVEVVKTNLSLS